MDLFDQLVLPGHEIQVLLQIGSLPDTQVFFYKHKAFFGLVIHNIRRVVLKRANLPPLARRPFLAQIGPQLQRVILQLLPSVAIVAIEALRAPSQLAPAHARRLRRPTLGVHQDFLFLVPGLAHDRLQLVKKGPLEVLPVVRVDARVAVVL